MMHLDCNPIPSTRIAEAQFFHQNSTIRTAWSPDVVIRKILQSVQLGGYTFHGIVAENITPRHWDWLDTECLLWMCEVNGHLLFWPQVHQVPLYNIPQKPESIERILGHFESSSGTCYVAVKWKDLVCPTWEREEDIAPWGDVVTDYFARVTMHSTRTY